MDTRGSGKGRSRDLTDAAGPEVWPNPSRFGGDTARSGLDFGQAIARLTRPHAASKAWLTPADADLRRQIAARVSPREDDLCPTSSPKPADQRA